MRIGAAAVAAWMVVSGGQAAAQGRSYATVTDFARKELGMPLAGLGLHLSMSPEASGKGKWDARLQQLVIDHPLRNRPLIAEAAIRKLAAHCQARGGRLEHDMRAAFQDSQGKEIVFGRSPRMGVHSCKGSAGPLFTMAVTTSPREEGKTYTGLDGSPMRDDYEPINYTFRLQEGEFAEARRAFAAVVGERSKAHEVRLAEQAQSEVRAGAVGEAVTGFRSKIAPGDRARRGGRSVLVVEVKPPLVLVQPSGEPTTWVRLDELSPD